MQAAIVNGMNCMVFHATSLTDGEVVSQGLPPVPILDNKAKGSFGLVRQATNHFLPAGGCMTIDYGSIVAENH